MNLKFKNIIVISLIFLVLLISLGGINATNIDEFNIGVINDNSSNIEDCTALKVVDYDNAAFKVANKNIGSSNLAISDENILSYGNSTNRSFDDIQIMVNHVKENGSIKLYGYYKSNGTLIDVNKSLTIDGNGAILDGNNLTSFFYIHGNNITLKNINFINCPNISIKNSQGSIYWRGSNCLLDNCTFSNIDTCGIFADMVNGTISNCKFINCSTNSSGGAILWAGSNGKVSNCNFISCSALYGGAVNWGGNNGSMSFCIFDGCSAKKANMVYWNSSNGTFTNNTFYIKSTDKFNRLIYGISTGDFGNNSNKLITKTSVSITIKEVGKYYNSKSITITLNKKIKNQKITLKFNNGVIATVTTNSKGVATYNISFAPGKYSVTAVATSDYLYDFKSTTLKNIAVSKAIATLNVSKLSTYYNSSKYFPIKVILNKKPISNVTLYLKVYTNKSYVTAKVITGSNGIAYYNCSKLSVGTHKVVVSCLSSNKYVTASSKNSSIVISPKYKATITPYKLSTTYGSGKYFQVSVKSNNKSISNIKLKLKIFTGSYSSTVYVTTGSNGIAYYNASKLSVGTHKVVISSSMSSNYLSASSKNSSIVISSKYKATITPYKLSTTYASGKLFKVYVYSSNKTPISNIKLKLKVYTGNYTKTINVTTNSKGYAYYNCSRLSVGTHKVVITSLMSSSYLSTSSKNSSIVIKKATTNITAPKVTNAYKANKTFNITIKNSASGAYVKGLKITVKVYTNSTYKTYNITTNDKGVASFSTKNLSKGTHKVQIATTSNYYSVSKSGNLIVIT